MSQKVDLEYASEVVEKVESVFAEGAIPLVVLDLDLTLFDNRERTRAILRDFIHASMTDKRQQASALERLTGYDIVYSIQQNMSAIGVEGEQFRKEGLPFWMERFFSDRYCVFDVPYGGAPEACGRLLSLGAHIVYLTGRYADTQAAGTVKSLRHYGFPVAELGTQLVMKTSRQESDYAYKRRVAETLVRLGTPVAAVDNEPGHCNTMSELFPAASVAQFGNMHSPQAPQLADGVKSLGDWAGFLL